MSTFIVQSVTPSTPPSYTTANGVFFTYKLAGLLDGHVEASAEIGTKDNLKIPYPSEQITCVLTGRTPYGIKIKRDNTAQPWTGVAPVMTPVSALVPQSIAEQPITQQAVPTAVVTAVAPYEDKTQTSIERQNSLTNAIAFCSAKKDMYLSLKRPDEAEKQLTGKHIVDVATYFHRYTSGKIIASMDIEDVAASLGYKKPEAEPIAKTAAEVFKSQLEDRRPEEDLEEAPF